MKILKKICCDYYETNEGDMVIIHHSTASKGYDYISRTVDQLPAEEQDADMQQGPSYSEPNGNASYYIGCGVVTKVFQNGTCNVMLKCDTQGSNKKTGRPSKWGEKTVRRTVRIPLTVDDQIKQPKGETIAKEDRGW